jgi:hypothetical protein
MKHYLLVLILSFCLLRTAAAQTQVPFALVSANRGWAGLDAAPADNALSVAGATPYADGSEPSLLPPPALPRMAPELALQAFQTRAARQAAELVSYSATTVVRAELPGTAQRGEFELRRMYNAPRTLLFKAIRFSGDNFVKGNVITRLLQAEVDHVQKDDSASTAISPANYKFSFKGTSQLESRVVHVYQLKPREKRPGLFRGRIYLDAHTGSLVRAEGSAVKSPSFFIRKIEFVQDYGDFDSFTFPVHMHSEAKARLVGKAVVDIYHRDYRSVANTVQSARAVIVSPIVISTE